MKLLVPAVVLVFVGLLSAAEGKKPADAGKKDLDNLKGSWSATAMEVGGQKAAEADVKNSKIIFDGEKVTLVEGDKKKPATFKLDASKKPATMDITPTEGPEKGKVTKAIYMLDGDTLKIAMALDEKSQRPTAFSTKKDTPVCLMVFKRDKK
jgi:uncharacterized protein (TIGR03067 family)